MKTVPYLTFSRTLEALTFYKSVGATDIQVVTGADEAFAGQVEQLPLGDRSPDQFVLNAGFRLLGQSIYCSDSWNDREVDLTDTSVCFEFNLNNEAEVDAVNRFMTLVAENGGEVTMPLAEAEWTAMFGQVTDPFGVSWLFNGIADSI